MILEARNLHKTYGTRRGRVVAVQGISLHIADGEILAVLGPNGAGKTTTIKMICGLVTPDDGDVVIAGHHLSRDAAALRHVGAVLEGNRNLYPRLTPLENLEYFGMLKGLSRREARHRGADLLKRFGLAEKAKSLTATLSRGMQQKVALAVALVHRPALLLLDEPTLGLDVEATIEVKRLVQEITQIGHGILLTTHQIEVAEEVANRVAIIVGGKVIAEGPTQELTRSTAQDVYLVELADKPEPKRVQALGAIGAVVEDRKVRYGGDRTGFWQMMDILQPLSILRIEKDHVGLNEAFLQLVREARDAQANAR